MDAVTSSQGKFFDSPAGRLLEITVVFAGAMAVLAIAGPWAGVNPLKGQIVAWVANVLMLLLVWCALRLRGQKWSHFGLRFIGAVDGRAIWGAVWRSLVVFVCALVAFSIGAIAAAMILGRPEQADLSGYNYLSGNLPLLALALISVFIVSSFGEEVLYRGFLMTRLAEVGGESKTAWRIALVIGAVVFGLIHYKWGAAGMVQTGFMGLALGIAYLKVGRKLWILVLAHFYLDFILLVQMYLAPA